jgi:hypothetical protein
MFLLRKKLFDTKKRLLDSYYRLHDLLSLPSYL